MSRNQPCADFQRNHYLHLNDAMAYMSGWIRCLRIPLAIAAIPAASTAKVVASMVIVGLLLTGCDNSAPNSTLPTRPIAGQDSSAVEQSTQPTETEPSETIETSEAGQAAAPVESESQSKEATTVEAEAPTAENSNGSSNATDSEANAANAEQTDAPAEKSTPSTETVGTEAVEAVAEAVESSNSEAEDVPKSARTSTIVPPSRAYLPPNRNTAPPPPLPAPKSERELAEERKIREAAKKRGELTFDDLVFDMEKGGEFKEEMLGQENWDLHEKTWKIRGFILPTTLFSQTGITEFVLVRDNQECCFGPGAALYDCIIVTMEPGKSISYTTRVVTVKGKLEIDTESFRYPDDEGHYAVYKMTAEEVK